MGVTSWRRVIKPGFVAVKFQDSKFKIQDSRFPDSRFQDFKIPRIPKEDADITTRLQQ